MPLPGITFVLSLTLAVHVPAVGASHVSLRSHLAAPIQQVPLPDPLADCLKENKEKCYRNPSVWGPPAWFFLHSVTLALPDVVPEEQQKSLAQLMYNMQKILPCPSCGIHLSEHMREHPIEPHLSTRDGMIQWMIDIHNMVNQGCGKRVLAKEEVLRNFNADYASKAKTPTL
mmetsp:Transcript_68893/g.149931  ORF Transcript_68893/g.149931 Transcript_68893/m.149931 type:complete len:172 (-) Transcript_68893:136-651(-)|eukprot:CAMPEP_0170609172 /NCGR_PEP_ID=MMETSP0224-20130122/21979_1 /TAXON_ID=285029 /ORGANISM="Togula jolla, Strain CCCM 725" /LENGTH=171 /DNA_ID=CAMNT_0010934453 /DNA_START=17 /DNA_END=532 /DNA_ORIENTATION=+